MREDCNGTIRIIDTLFSTKLAVISAKKGDVVKKIIIGFVY